MGIRQVEAAVQANHEREYFSRLAAVAGGALSALAFFLPVVRQQPLLRRCLLAGAPGYLLHNWTRTHGEDIWWGRTLGAYKKFVTSNNGYDTQPYN